jgi:hypothetical protein
MFESKGVLFALGFGAGAVAMALLDPRRGGARRALVRDKARHWALESRQGLMEFRRDAANRLRGRLYEARARSSEDQVPDDILVERVRAQLGRPVSHPRALEVRAEDGCVVLSGPILASEVAGLISRISRVRGVRSIDSELDVHQSEDIPALQSGRQPRGTLQ